MRFLCLFLGTNFYLCYSNCFLCLWGGVESRTDLSWCVKIEKYQEEIQNTVCAKMQNTENAKYKIHKFKEKYKIKDRKLQRRNTKIRRRNINIPAEGGDRRRAGCAKIQKYKKKIQNGKIQRRNTRRGEPLNRRRVLPVRVCALLRPLTLAQNKTTMPIFYKCFPSSFFFLLKFVLAFNSSEFTSVWCYHVIKVSSP